MDFGSALLLSLLVFVLIETAKTFLPDSLAGKLRDRVLLGLALGIGVGAGFLIRASDWAHDQVVLGKPLDEVNTFSVVVIGLLIGAGAVGIHKAIEVGKNIGQNATPPKA